MRRERQEITHRGRRRATLETEWWRRFGALCLQLCLILGGTGAAAQNEQDPNNEVKFTNLVNFDGTSAQYPNMAPVQGSDGNLYATTGSGGVGGNGSFNGTVFKITPGGTLTALYDFCSQPNCADGSTPDGALVLGSDGNFYGVTTGGGANGAGTVFKITPSGTFTTLYNWCSQPNCADGMFGLWPVFNAPFVQATDGNFYGVNSAGGNAFGAGTVFRITPGGTLTTLHTFCSQPNCSDGALPQGLIQATDGNFYGTSLFGGANGDGNVFKMTPTGKFTTLYSFCSQGGLGACTDGAIPNVPPIQATDGNLYGTTSYGGDNCPPHCGGTVFKITLTGTLTTLYSFGSEPNGADGNNIVGLVQATDGNFYGATGGGGIPPGCFSFFGRTGCGTVFKITPEGKLTTLHNFCSQPNCADGNTPLGLFQATNGTLYGSTLLGGTCGGCGLVFTLSLGLGPFVETVPTAGTGGQAVTILGTDLSGVTEVRFGGAAAQFKSISTTEIQTTVPGDAHTGFVTVHTPSGTLQSNVKFQVLP
jgi:uncharacterized repeat protein (TIGR03803 family)